MTKWKQNNYRFWHSPIVLIFLFLLFLLFGYNIIDLIKKEEETSYKKELVLSKIKDLKEKEAYLSLNISKLDTEEGMEEVIRDKYQVTKTGEKMIIIVDEDKNVSNAQESYNEGKTRYGLWVWFSDLFKK